MAQEIRVHTSLPDGSAGTINMTLHCLYNCEGRVCGFVPIKFGCLAPKKREKRRECCYFKLSACELSVTFV
jgi:hypothetical protein